MAFRRELAKGGLRILQPTGLGLLIRNDFEARSISATSPYFYPCVFAFASKLHAPQPRALNALGPKPQSTYSLYRYSKASTPNPSSPKRADTMIRRPTPARAAQQLMAPIHIIPDPTQKFISVIPSLDFPKSHRKLRFFAFRWLAARLCPAGRRP